MTDLQNVIRKLWFLITLLYLPNLGYKSAFFVPFLSRR